MKRVVLTSTKSHIYDFFLPISATLWRDLIGYQPVIILIGREEEWSVGHHKVALEELRNKNFDVHWIDHIPNVSDASVSMSVRQHASALELPLDDLMIIGDVDLIPLRPSFYHQHDHWKNTLGIYHADTYGDVSYGDRRMANYWPAYGPSMSVKIWRDLMGVIPGNLLGSLEKTFREEDIYTVIAANKTDWKNSKWWTFDEERTSKKIRESKYLKDAVYFNCPRQERLSRGSTWPEHPYVANYVDAHFERPGYVGKAWQQIRGVLSQVVPHELRWLDKYVSAYRANGYQLHTV